MLKWRCRFEVNLQHVCTAFLFQNETSFKFYLGHWHLSQSSAVFRGDVPFPVRWGILGRTTGRSSSVTATGPHEVQWTMGMGVPQKRCLEISQSRSFVLVRYPPTFLCWASWVIELKASSWLWPVNYIKRVDQRLQSATNSIQCVKLWRWVYLSWVY